jgi:Flp pilus assembly protein TadG
MSSAISSRQLGRRGTAALEFGLVCAAFALLLLAVMDLGRFYLTLHSLHTVLGSATRAALVDPTLSGCTTPVQRVASSAPFLQSSALSLCVTQGVSGGMTTVTVTASYPFNAVLPAWAGAAITLSDSTTASY